MIDRPLKILVVENDETDVVALRRTFAEIGSQAELTNVTTYREALKVLDEYDAVIVDLGLDDQSLIEDLDLLEAFADLPSVVFTGSPPPDISRRIGRKQHGLIVKGISGIDFLAMVAHEIGRFEAELEERTIHLKQIEEYQERLKVLPGLEAGW